MCRCSFSFFFFFPFFPFFPPKAALHQEARRGAAKPCRVAAPRRFARAHGCEVGLCQLLIALITRLLLGHFRNHGSSLPTPPQAGFYPHL